MLVHWQPSPRVGLASHVHAAKLPAWTLRLRTATALLADAVQRGDRREALDQVADVWFWEGRIVCDAMSAVDSPAHDATAADAFAAMAEARGPLYRARLLLLGG